MKRKYLRFILLLPLFVFFSCASVPKTESPSLPQESSVASDNDSEINENPTSEENTELQGENVDIQNESTSPENEETSLNSPEDTDEEAISNLIEEIVIPDQLEELPEIESPEEEPEITDNIEIEPEVQEAENFENEKIILTTESTEEETEAEEKADISEVEQKEEITETMEKTDEIEKENSIDEAVSEENMQNQAELEEAEEIIPEKNEITPSRSITIGKNQTIDIYYPGKGWIYQGCIDEEGNIDSRNKYFVFGGRKLGGQDQCFMLRSRVPGKYLLHFYKNDILTGSYIDDYLEVIVENRISDSAEHITVPKYEEIVPPKVTITHEKVKEERKRQKEALKTEQIESNNTQPTEENEKKSSKSASVTNLKSESQEKVSTTIQTSESSPEESAPVESKENQPSSEKKESKTEIAKKSSEETYTEEKLESLNEEKLLELAQKFYDQKDFQNALKTINKFFDKASNNLDKGLYLQGQILEEKSPVQNIKDAVESYELLVKKYPASKLWDKANKRSIYLRRFYINIR